MKRRVRKRLTRTLQTVTDGVVGTVTDFTLLFLFSCLDTATSGKKTMYDVLFGANEASRWHEDLNYQTIKRTLYRLTHEGLIHRLKRRDPLAVEITALGKKRIASLMPVYQVKRPWDGHLYIISYDIPSQYNKKRDLLRTYIKRTGGAPLQDSLFINPYNPTTLLTEFSREHAIPGSILVSRLGKDGSIGEEKLENLLNRVYHLDDLADRYDAFLGEFPQTYTGDRLRLLIAYTAILKDDPQLPFPLLPADFPGEEAYQVCAHNFPEFIFS